MRIAFPHVHALIGKNHSFHASICYLLLLKEFRGHHGILYPKSTGLLPSFNLTKVIFFQPESERQCDAENNEKNEGEVLEGDVLLKEIPKRCYPKRSKDASYRGLLNQIKSLTFVVYDNDALDQLHETLSADLKDFSRHAPVEDNLVVEKPRVIRNQAKKFPPLPKPKEKKSALSGRIGVSTGKRKSSLSN